MVLSNCLFVAKLQLAFGDSQPDNTVARCVCVSGKKHMKTTKLSSQKGENLSRMRILSLH